MKCLRNVCDIEGIKKFILGAEKRSSTRENRHRSENAIMSAHVDEQLPLGYFVLQFTLISALSITT